MKKIVLTTILFMAIIIIVVFLTNTFENDYEDLTRRGNTIAMYIEDEDGEYKESNSNKFPTEGYSLNLEMSSCKNGSILTQDENTLSISLKAKTPDECSLYFEIDKFNAVQAVTAIMTNNRVKGVNKWTPDFSKVATTDEGVFAQNDDYGTSYYYRGAVENNYLKFANLDWRIVRVNGDGSLRVIYYEDSPIDFNDTKIKNSIFSEKIDDPVYVGLKYTLNDNHGLTEKSTMLIELENWYENYLRDYEQFIDKDAGFCNDRVIVEDESVIDTWTFYNSSKRLKNYTPSLKCEDSRDLFTLQGSKYGNKALEYSIGLITADEVSLAGGSLDKSNDKFYLYSELYSWTMSPLDFNGPANSRSLLIFGGNSLTYSYYNTPYYIRPVINLKAEYVSTFIGDGTKTDPFRLD